MEFDPRQIFVHAIGFLILLAILRKFAWGSLLKIMEDRSASITGEFDRIERMKKELDGLKLDYQKHLDKIEEEARVKIQQAVAEGRRVAMEIEEDARAHSRETLEKTKSSVALEIAKARLELKEHIVDLAIQLNHKILQQNLDEESDRRMIEGFIREVNSMDASK